MRAGRIRKRLAELQSLAAACFEEELLGKVSEEIWGEINCKWEREGAELRAELATIAPAMKRAEFLKAVRTPFELAKTAAAQFIAQEAREKGRLGKHVVRTS